MIVAAVDGQRRQLDRPWLAEMIAVGRVDQVLPQDVGGPCFGALHEHQVPDRPPTRPRRDANRALPCHMRFTAMIVPIATTSIAVSDRDAALRPRGAIVLITARLHETKHAAEILELHRELDGARPRDEALRAAPVERRPLEVPFARARRETAPRRLVTPSSSSVRNGGVDERSIHDGPIANARACRLPSRKPRAAPCRAGTPAGFAQPPRLNSSANCALGSASKLG